MSSPISLEIIPAIDLHQGQAVRLRRGDFGTAEKVAEDPVAVASRFADEGATRLHVVDLDGAKTGLPANLGVVQGIVRAVGDRLAIQLGGGLRSADVIAATFAAAPGLAAVIVGTTAATGDEAVIREILDRHGDRVIVGADTRDGYVAVHGWTESTTETAIEFGTRLVALGARRFLYTDVARDGMLDGVNVEATRKFSQEVGAPVLASGGVSGPEDIEKLAAVAQPGGVEGVIIGKALYAGRLTLADALRIAAGSPSRV
jgi:phosphoribosylformimino-5-aminoimidazole carboxamide ribotide isomerase